MSFRASPRRSRNDGRRSKSTRDAESAFELLAPRATYAEAGTALELNFIVAACTAMERVDEIDANDDRAVDAKESFWIESFLERMDRLTDQVGTFARVQLDVGTARGDVLDLRDRYHANFAAHFDCDALEVRR